MRETVGASRWVRSASIGDEQCFASTQSPRSTGARGLPTPFPFTLVTAREAWLPDFLRSTEHIDYDHPAVRTLAGELAGNADRLMIVARCFEWVRDQIRHSSDWHDERVTVTASDVLQAGTGLCYAKSHLLAALLRANDIPCGLVYQRLADEGSPSGFCLHGLNAVWLPDMGWHRIDARGNRPGLATQFDPPREVLAFTPEKPGESTLEPIFADPLPVVIEALTRFDRLSDLNHHLPDWSGEAS